MFLKEITKQSTLNTFVTASIDGNFLQSWEWGEFQKSLGRNIWRIGVFKPVEDEEDDSKSVLKAVATIVEYKLPLGLSYLYCPYGPVFQDGMSLPQREEVTKLILTELRSITIETKNYTEIFARIEPRIRWEEIGNFFLNLGMKKTQAVQPQDTQVVDLTIPDNWLLKEMHSKTRYNIRLAEKKGVKVRKGSSIEDLKIFWELMQMTTARDGFSSHEYKYYESLWNKFHFTDLDNQMDMTIELLIAEYEGKAIATVLLGFFGKKAVYLHGASNHEYRKVMAPHLLQWESMKLAKQADCTMYDLWGVKPANRHLDSQSKENKWAGITRFKKSFGGKEVNYVGAWDFVYDKKLYWLYKFGRKFL